MVLPHSFSFSSKREPVMVYSIGPRTHQISSVQHHEGNHISQVLSRGPDLKQESLKPLAGGLTAT